MIDRYLVAAYDADMDPLIARLTGYDKFLLDMRKHVPVITAIGYIGKNGKMYKSNQESKYSKYINMYNTLQYNYFADDKKRVKNFFYLK